MNKSELQELITNKLCEFDQMYRRGSETKKLAKAAEIWTDAFMEFAGAPNFEEAFDRAMLEHVKESKFFPTPAEVIACMKPWLKREAPVPVCPPSAGETRRRHNAQVAQAIRLAIRQDKTKRVEGLKLLVRLKVLSESVARMYL